jgi:hypothetical protein
MPAAVVAPSQRTASFLFALIRPRIGVSLGLAVILFAGVTGFRMLRVHEIPDLSAEFERDRPLPETEELAGTVWEDYRIAGSKVTEGKFNILEIQTQTDWLVWEQVPEEVQSWTIANREAIEQCKTASLKFPLPTRKPQAETDAVGGAYYLIAAGPMRSLQAEAEGKLDEAAEMALAAYQCTFDLDVCETEMLWWSHMWRHAIRMRLAQLSASPGADIEFLRRLRAGFRTAQSQRPLPSSAVRKEYHLQIKSMRDWSRTLAWEQQPRELDPIVEYLFNEPERTHRILQSFLANVADHIDEPIFRRQPTSRPWPDELLHTETRAGRLSPERIRALGERQERLELSKLMRWVSGVDQTMLFDRAEDQLLETMIGLQMVNRLRGRFPASLEELVAIRELDLKAIDPMSSDGARLGYRITESDITVWSVGSNQLDDGGKDDPRNVDVLASQGFKDIVMRFEFEPPAFAEVPLHRPLGELRLKDQ